MTTIARIGALHEMPSMTGRLDEDNLRAFWDIYRRERDLERTVNALPSRRPLLPLGYRTDLEHSSISVGNTIDQTRVVVTHTRSFR